MTDLWIAVGAEPGATTRGALTRLLESTPPLPAPVRILAGDKALTGSTIVAAIRSLIPGVDGAVAPPSLAAQALAMTRSADYWQSIPLGQPDATLAAVAVPVTLADAGSWVYLVRSRRGRTDDPLALDLLARFVHPRLALLLRGDADRAGLLAEVNLARQPRIVVIQARLPPWSLVAATTDLIAAELFGLAFREQAMAPEVELTGPWEDRTVQRATELELGATLPGSITLRIVPCSPRFDPARPPETVMASLDGIRARLGIPEPPVMLPRYGE